jgi:hypothetical protein
MPVTARLSKRFYEVLGEDIEVELVVLTISLNLTKCLTFLERSG